MKRKALLTVILALCLAFTLTIGVLATGAAAPVKECSSEECTQTLNPSDIYCPKCGTEYVEPQEVPECPTCKDDSIDSGFCPTCGRQISKQMEFKVDANSLGLTIPILCTGMLGIFIVTTIIIGIVIFLNTILEVIDKKRKNME